MKIAVVDPWHFTPPYDHELVSALARAGHEVRLITQAEAQEGQAAAAPEALIQIGHFRAAPAWAKRLPGPLALITKGLRHLSGMLRLIGALRRFEPDVIHFQWVPLPLLDAPIIAVLRRFAPTVLTVHDSNPYNGSGPWLLRAGVMLAIRRFDRLIVHTEAGAASLVEAGILEDRIHRVPHGLLHEHAAAGAAEPEAERPVTFLQFGKIKSYKGVDVLLEALARLEPETRAQCRVRVVGRPYVDTAPLCDLVRRHRLEDVVELKFDFVADAEMERLFACTDVMVFPYRAIDASGVLMAAIAAGRPIVASRIGCFAEMLGDGREALLVPPDDPAALAAALGRLIESAPTRRQMAEAMQALKRQIPGWDQIAAMTIAVYAGAHHLEPAPDLQGRHADAG